MRRLRIAVVGVGAKPEARSGGHLDVIKKLSDMYDLCVLCDLSKERLREAGERYGVQALYTDLDEMLRQEKPDVVYRLTPTDSVAMVTFKTAEAGVHIINEIPIALTLPMADAMIDVCRRNNVKMEVAENVWLWPAERLKQMIVRAGLLGRATHARLQYPCGGYHGFNAIRMILGTEPKRVLGYEGKVPVIPQKAYGGAPMTESFWEAGILEFPDDVRCLYELPPKGRSWRHFWEIEGTHGHLAGETLVLYENGKEVSYPFRPVHEQIDGKQMLSELRVDTDPPVVWKNPFKSCTVAARGHGPEDVVAKACILASMYRAVTEDIEPEYGAANARRDLETWIAVRESGIRGNVWIDLPLTELTELERRFNAAFEKLYGHDPLKDIDALADVPFTRHSVIWEVAGWL